MMHTLMACAIATPPPLGEGHKRTRCRHQLLQVGRWETRETCQTNCRTVLSRSVLSLCVCENRDGWLVAWGLWG